MRRKRLIIRLVLIFLLIGLIVCALACGVDPKSYQNVVNQLLQAQTDLLKLQNENSALKQQVAELNDKNKKLQDEIMNLKSTPSPVPSEAAKPAPAPQSPAPSLYGGILKLAIGSAPKNIGYPPYMNLREDFIYSFPAVETLFRYDEKGQLVPWLAESWNIAADSKSITINIRHGIKFHDGTDLNAEAVKYNLDLFRTSNRGEFKFVSSIDIIDPYSVRLNLFQFDSRLLPNLGEYAGMIVSPTALKEQGTKWAGQHPVGTGPFKFIAWDDSIKYAKFEGYWKKGLPYLDGIEINPNPYETVVATALQSGKVTAGEIITPVVLSDLKAKGYHISEGKTQVIGLISDSAHADSPFANIKVRQAIAYAIDAKAISQLMGSGFWWNSNQPLIPPNVTGYPYDPAKALQLLAEAGFRNGFRTNLIYLNTDSNTDVCNAIKEYLAQSGIIAQLQAMNPDQFLQARTNGWKNGLLLDSWDMSYGKELVQFLWGQFSKESGGYSCVFYPADYEAKLATTLTQPDSATRLTLSQALAKDIIDKYCLVICLYADGPQLVTSINVHDVNLLERWFMQWTPEKAWLSK